LARGAGRETHDEERVMPEQKRVASIELRRTLLVTLLGSGAFLILIAIFLWMQHDIDRAVVMWGNAARESGALVPLAQALTRYGMTLIVIGLLAYMSLTFVTPSLADTQRLSAVFLLSFAVIGVGGDLLKDVFKRPRPSTVNAFEANAKPKNDTYSFPSGHATKSMALAVPFVIFVPNRRRWIVLLKGALLLVALSVCSSRILLARHYLSDVLGAFGLTLLLLPVLILVCNRIFSRTPVEKLGVAVKVWTLALLGLALLLPFL
jgi:membrane-associated phospholipid phosphatase